MFSKIQTKISCILMQGRIADVTLSLRVNVAIFGFAKVFRDEF